MYELDEQDSATLVNHPSPHIPRWFREKLTELGGTSLSGRPIFRVIWGQAERHVDEIMGARGRIKYPTPFYTEKEDYKFRLRNLETSEARLCTYGEFMEAKKKANRTFAAPLRFYRSLLDWGMKELPEWSVSRTIDWVGIPRFIVEQFKRPDQIVDTPLNWAKNQNRKYWSPENRREEFGPVIQNYPHAGRYEHFITVQEENGTRYGKFRPLGEDVLDEIRKVLAYRESWTPKPIEQSVREFYEAVEAKETKEEAAMADELNREVQPYINTLLEDQPHVRG